MHVESEHEESNANHEKEMKKSDDDLAAANDIAKARREDIAARLIQIPAKPGRPAATTSVNDGSSLKTNVIEGDPRGRRP